MDCAPLNLAHFHERRAEKFLRHHRYDDAYKAIETSLLYVQDSYKNAMIDKSIEVLDTQKWDYERKLRQIKMRQLQYERLKQKEIIPSTADSTSSTLSRQESSVTAVSATKSIDKTIEDFDAKFSCLQLNRQHRTSSNSKENQDPKTEKLSKTNKREVESVPVRSSASKKSEQTTYDYESEDFPTLAPLELPSFDFNAFTSTTALTNIEGLLDNFKK